MARAVARDKPISTLVELRVHGVGGSSPEAVLGVELASRFTDQLIPGIPGDESAGFFQPGDASRRTEPDRRLEAYSWGGLTSRSAARALWLILAPFAMANLASWMIEHDGEPTQPTRTASWYDVLNRSLARLVGLTLTVETFFLATRVALDQFAIQCGSQATWCGHWWLRPLSFTDGRLGRNLIVGMAFPIGLLTMIGLITRRSQTYLHQDWRPSETKKISDPAFVRNLTHAQFWKEAEVGHRLGIPHVAAGFSIAGLTLIEVVTTSSGTDFSLLRSVLWISLTASAVLVAVVEISTLMRWFVLASTVVAIAVLAVSTWMLDLVATTPSANPTAAMDQRLFSGQIFIIAALVLSTLIARWSRHDSTDGSIVRWLMPPSLMVAAAGLISAFGNGFTIAVASLLGEAGPRGGEGMIAREPGTILYGQSAGLVASVFVLALAAMAVAASGFYFKGRAQVHALAAISDEYVPPVEALLARRIRRARALARVPDRAPEILFAGVATLVVILTALLVRSGGRLESPAFSDTFRFMHGFASLVLLSLPVVGAVLIFQAYRRAGWRRVVGIVWDVATFWPRWFHPFAPPSYGERAIPDLDRRLALMEADGETVVISAHSQGTLLAAAALAVGATKRVALITHGSPLHRLYARFFPEYLGGGFATLLKDRLGERWINLYRLSDYIGGSIPDCGDDRIVADPLSPADDESLHTHLEYDREAPYEEALQDLAARF